MKRAAFTLALLLVSAVAFADAAEKSLSVRTFTFKYKDAEKAAAIIANGVERGKRVVEFPRALSLLTRIGRLMPDAMWDRAVRVKVKR